MNQKSVFDYGQWPVIAYGGAIAPKVERAQWQAFISAGGQNDAVVCFANTKDDVVALRKRILNSEQVAFLLQGIERIDKENKMRGDSDRTSELIQVIRNEYKDRFAT